MERAHRKPGAAIALGILLACCRCASALNPSLDVNQYAHTTWTVRDGFFKGTTYAIAQTPDGYLWLGTDFGLLRFDGVRSVKWLPPTGEQLPSDHIRSLLVGRDGRLWIGTDQGLASWGNGRLIHYPDLAGSMILAVLEDREGTIWAGGDRSSNGGLCAIRSGSAQCYGEDGRFGRAVTSLYEDSRGNLWAGASTGLWRWKPGPPKVYPMPDYPPEFGSLIEGENGAVLIPIRGGGIKQLVYGKAEPYPLPGVDHQFMPNWLLRDRNGGLWIGTLAGGLMHVHQGRTDVFARSDGLSGDLVRSLFEDREGNIWVGTTNGLDRFRDLAVPTTSVKRGLSNPFVWSVLSARDGSIWLGTPDGLNRWSNGKITIYHKPSGLVDNGAYSLFQDDRGRIWVSTLSGVGYFENDRFIPVRVLPGGQVLSFAEDSTGDLWISYLDRGLFRLVRQSVMEQIPWAVLGHRDPATVLVASRSQGGLWLGFSSGGISWFADGKIRMAKTAADGLGEGRVNDLRLDRDGTLWAATEGGLSRLKSGRVSTLTSKNGLPCDAVQSAIEDDAHSFWLEMACGLVRIARTELDAWVNDSRRTIRVTVFDGSDGARSDAMLPQYTPRVAISADGKLWFATRDGPKVVDPTHLPFNKVPPPVRIEQIRADGRTYWQNWPDDASSHVHLPALVRDVSIDYTALSLVAPEKVRFRIKLEGQDKGWRELSDRHLEYTNLPPKHYRFRVLACNNSGVWNEEGATLDFVIPPMWYQTNWFLAACVAAFLAMIWGIYELRVRQLAHQFNMRLEERVAERTRIARDLHDTLLQSFQGLLLQFQAVSYRLQPGEIKKSLDAAIAQASQAITEGRDTVQGLRASTIEKNDLAVAIRSVGEELASAEISQSPPRFQVFVEGRPRNLHPILRDEVYRVAAEALRNAFKHAQAHQIEVELRYESKDFKVRIRDDGRGIDREILTSDGRKGHFGLHGMRERAKLAGGELAVWSEQDAGTEIELTIPASRAYTRSARGFWWFRNRSEKDTQEKVES